VSETTVRELLDAVWAPSANNLQPWSFVVIQDRTLLKKISDAAKVLLANDPHWHTRLPLTDPDFDIFYGCGTLIVICA
jgi:nitroreductase